MRTYLELQEHDKDAVLKAVRDIMNHLAIAQSEGYIPDDFDKMESDEYFLRKFFGQLIDWEKTHLMTPPGPEEFEIYFKTFKQHLVYDPECIEWSIMED